MKSVMHLQYIIMWCLNDLPENTLFIVHPSVTYTYSTDIQENSRTYTHSDVFDNGNEMETIQREQDEPLA